MRTAIPRGIFFSLLLIAGNYLFHFAHASAEPSKTPVFINSEPADSLGIALGDIDGDGDLDIALANKSTPSQVFRNDGAGNYALAWEQNQYVAEANDVKWGDLDGDGDLDLVFVYKNAATQIYRNDVNQHPSNDVLFSPTWQSPIGDADSRGLAIADLNSDGLLDLIVTTAMSGTQVFADQESLSFSLVTQISTSAEDVDVADMDADGDLDVALAARVTTVLSNVGNFAFESLPINGLTPAEPVAVRWGDAENDGDLDLVAMVGSVYNGNNLYLYRNSSGSFEQVLVRQTYANNWPSDLAWEDYDGDGDIDIIVSNYLLIGERYVSCGCIEVLANDGIGKFSLSWDTKPDSPGYSAVALGDVDLDGDLDIIGSTLYGWGGMRTRSRYYPQGVGFSLTRALIDSRSGETNWPREMLTADLDNDGDLDLIISAGYSYVLYRNDGKLQFPLVGYDTPTNPASNIHALATGDIDLDGDLDLAIGFAGSPLQVLRNDGNFSFIEIWEAPDSTSTYGLDWVDMDGDGLLDLVAANYNARSMIYRNSGNFSFSLLWADTGIAPTVALAVQDVDQDGDSDIALGRKGQPAIVLRNTGAGQMEQLWTSPTTPLNLFDIILSDLNGDRLPDLVLGLKDGGGEILQNVAGTQFVPRLDLSLSDSITSLALGDINADGYLDLALAGNWFNSSIWVLTNLSNFQFSLAWRSQPKSYCFFCNIYEYSSAAWADMDEDGTIDLVVSSDTTQEETPETNIYRTNSNQNRIAMTTLPILTVQPPSSAGGTKGGVGKIADQPVLAVPVTRRIESKVPIAWIDADYSINGGGVWQSAIPVPNSWHPGSSTFYWDTVSSGFFGQSDYVVLRARVLAQSPVPYPAATFRYTDTVAGPFQYAPRVSFSTPFRVRGTQLRVLLNGQTQAGAIAYRLPAGSEHAGTLLAGFTGAYRTNAGGYLSGAGQLGAGDRLLALVPVAQTAAYDVYYTSPTDHTTGLPSYTVTQAGVQTLTVSADNPLVLFNLDVALEWDASKDTLYLTQLQYDLNRTSELLYNWTNGQAALGRIRIFHDARRQPAGQDGFQPWLNSHIRIYATNRMHPNAIQGGITLDRTVETTPNGKTISYTPGMVHIGAVWDRYAESSALGEDWPRALAHELGHYLFFLDDNYIGQAGDGSMQFISADPNAGCPGVMNDPYTDFLAKFQPRPSWLPGCANTYSHQLLGRADWDTIATHYPWLKPPTTPIAQVNPGPSGLRLAFTQFEFVPPPDAPADQQALAVPVFTIATADGSAYRPSPDARGFLLQGGRLIDLGAPALDQLYARGVRNGDTLYLLEPDSGRAGYIIAAPSVDRLVVKPVNDWKPQVIITPINSRYLAIAVKGLNVGRSLRAQLYPRDGDATESIELAPTVDGYAGTFQLATEIFEGNLRIWDANDPFHQVLTDFVFGSNPERWDARDARWRARLARWRARFVPVIAAGGRVAVLGDNVAFGSEDWLFSLQTATALPSLPAWATPVGQGYWLHATANAPDLSGTAISFNYDRRDVPAGQETYLRVFFWNGTVWSLLSTNVDPEQSLASAHTQGPGLYALVAAPEIPLQGPGWNNFAFTLISDPSPIATALASITGKYTIVYSYDPADQANPWRSFDPTAPSWANDLNYLEYGKAYWIYATQSTTLHPIGGAAIQAASTTTGGPLPPAVLYGVVEQSAEFAPQPGMIVTAWVDGHSCGQSQTQALNDAVVYVIDVGSDTDVAGCGTAGRTIRFVVGTQEISTQVAWDNTRALTVPLSPSSPTPTPEPTETPSPTNNPTYNFWQYLPNVHN